jgi:hypothetical protein
MNKNKKLKAKIQAFQNELSLTKKIINPPLKTETVNINDLIKQDLKKTFIIIALSFAILFVIKYLDTNFLLNKFL